MEIQFFLSKTRIVHEFWHPHINSFHPTFWGKVMWSAEFHVLRLKSQIVLSLPGENSQWPRSTCHVKSFKSLNRNFKNPFDICCIWIGIWIKIWPQNVQFVILPCRGATARKTFSQQSTERETFETLETFLVFCLATRHVVMSQQVPVPARPNRSENQPTNAPQNKETNRKKKK